MQTSSSPLRLTSPLCGSKAIFVHACCRSRACNPKLLLPCRATFPKTFSPSQNSGLKGQKPEDSFELYNLHIQPGGGTMLEGLIRGVPCHAVKLHSLLVLRPQLEEICPAATASAVGICNVRWAMRSKKSSKATRETTTPSALSDFQIDQLTMTVNEFRIVYAPTSHFSPTLPFSLCISWNVAPWIPVVCEAKKLLAASVLEAGWTATLEDLQTVAAA